LADHPDPVLSAEALGLLVRTDPSEGTARIAKVLASGETDRIHAVMDCLERFPGRLEELLDEAFVHRHAESKNPRDRELAARAIGFLGDNLEMEALLPRLLSDPSPQVARAAAQTAGKLRQDWLVALLVDQLRRRPLRAAVRRALARFSEVGAEIVASALEDDTLDRELRRALPRVLVEFPEQRTVRRLFACLPQEDLILHHQILKALGKLRARHSHLRFPTKEVSRILDFDARRYAELAGKWVVARDEAPRHAGEAQALLARALEERLELMREILFRALGLNYPSEDIYNAWNRVVHGRPSVRAAALEFLGNVLSLEHRDRLLPLLEAPGWSKVDERGRELYGSPALERVSVLVDLISGADPWLAACGVTAAGELGTAGLGDVLRGARDHPAPMVREAARAVLERQFATSPAE
jgi:hypothetical protein